ncbi:MAG: PAS domain-containing protein, partial [Magnetococcales bacterium]|nr:PAS domain-containing protein [Magnetococcales bacterium]
MKRDDPNFNPQYMNRSLRKIIKRLRHLEEGMDRLQVQIGGQYICKISNRTSYRKQEKYMEKTFLEGKQPLREVTATLAEGLYVVDKDQKIILINPTALTMLGWQEKEVLGQKSHDMFHHSHTNGSPYPAITCPLCDVLNYQRVVTHQEEWFWRKDGSCFPVSMIASPILRQGKVAGAVDYV